MKVRLELVNGFILGFQLILEYKAAFINLGFFQILFDWEDEDDDF